MYLGQFQVKIQLELNFKAGCAKVVNTFSKLQFRFRNSVWCRVWTVANFFQHFGDKMFNYLADLYHFAS